MSELRCMVTACARPVAARRLCPMHYKRWRKHGDPTVVLPTHPPVSDRAKLMRWWANVKPVLDLGSCWPWNGGRTPRGYGVFNVDSRSVPAHRWGYQHLIAPLALRQVVRHTCDNPPCCRPDHWLDGTQAENVRDMYLRGRRAPTAGELNPNAKLAAAQVAEIRMAYAAGDISQSALSAQYGITQPMVSLIVRGGAW